MYPGRHWGREALVSKVSAMRRVRSVLLLLALFPATAADVQSQAQESATLYGQILENPGDRPIAEARVSLSPGSLSAVTGAGGRFVLRNIPYGRL